MTTVAVIGNELSQPCVRQCVLVGTAEIDVCPPVISPEAMGELGYLYDPSHPTPTIGGAVVSRPPGILAGAFNQNSDPRFFGCDAPFGPLAQRDDILVFSTQPLQADMEITGPIVANLWISSDCPDTDFTIKLIDEYPPNEDYPRPNRGLLTPTAE